MNFRIVSSESTQDQIPKGPEWSSTCGMFLRYALFLALPVLYPLGNAIADDQQQALKSFKRIAENFSSFFKTN